MPEQRRENKTKLKFFIINLKKTPFLYKQNRTTRRRSSRDVRGQRVEMKAEVILDCCSYEFKTCSSNFNFMDCYLLKAGEKPFKKYFKNRKVIKKEILFVALCPRCGHWILKFLWYDSPKANEADYIETKTIRGKKADEIFNRRMDSYSMINVPKVFKPIVIRTSEIPFGWTYGINKEVKRKGGIVSVRQYRSDFLGQKELIKETDVDGVEKPICYIYENLRGD